MLSTMDPPKDPVYESGDIRYSAAACRVMQAVFRTTSRCWKRSAGDDATTALDLLNAVDGPLVRVTADAASDTVAVYETARARGATVVVPPARTANVSGHGPRSPGHCQVQWERGRLGR